MGSVETTGIDGTAVEFGTEGPETGSDGDALVPGTEVTETGSDGDALMPSTEVTGIGTCGDALMPVTEILETGKEGKAPPVSMEPGRLSGNVEFLDIGIGAGTGRFRADAETVATTEAIARKLEERMATERWLEIW